MNIKINEEGLGRLLRQALKEILVQQLSEMIIGHNPVPNGTPSRTFNPQRQDIANLPQVAKGCHGPLQP